MFAWNTKPRCGLGPQIDIRVISAGVSLPVREVTTVCGVGWGWGEVISVCGVRVGEERGER